MINFLRRHIPWVFSGIGVVIVVAIWKFFSQASHTTERPKPPRTQAPTPWEEPSVSPPSGERGLLAPPPASSSIEPEWKRTAGDALQRIRREDGVKLMEAVHNELQFSSLPRGVFGYTPGDSLDDIKTARIRHDKFGWRFEIHKTVDGRAILVGFVSPEVEQLISREDRPPNYAFTVYSEPWRDAAVAVDLDLSKLIVAAHARSISLDGNDFAAIEVKLR